jgi:hypothetical protein
MILAAFAGGAFGAAIGALQSFVLAGFVVIVGEVYALAVRASGAALPVDITGTVAFGVVLGPHVAFGGGAAAVAYASKRGYLDTDFEYHDAKEVTRGLGGRPDVLAVGGVFGVLGYWVATLAGTFNVPTDPVALGVVVSALAHRIVFGYDVIGASLDELLDMSPYERGERQAEAVADGGTVTSERNRLAVEPWLPYQYRWSHVTMLGVVVGMLAAYTAYITASAFLAFGISVAALTFLIADVADVPVTHHISLPASTVVIASVPESSGSVTVADIAGALPLWQALLLGAVLGVVGALLGELLQRVFYAHADTHLDPPAASIVVTAALLGLAALVGVLPHSAWVPVP